MKIHPQVQMYAIGTIAVLGVLWYVKSKAGAAVDYVVDSVGAVGEAINPLSDKNLAYKAASATGVAVQSAAGLSGTVNGYLYDDYFFGAVDLLNPFNDSDEYAERVWGLKK